MLSNLRFMDIVLPLSALLAAPQSLVMAHPQEERAPALNSMTYIGCFSSSQPLSNTGDYQYQSSGHCQEVCVGNGNAPVLGLSAGDQCWCGAQIPAKSSQVDDGHCSTPCTGYGQDNCGGTGFFSVYLTGVTNNVAQIGSSPSPSGGSSTTGSPTSASPSVITSIAPGKTIVVTQAPGVDAGASQSAQATSKPAHKNIIGVVVGVIVGVIAVIAIVAGLLFYRRMRQRREAEESSRQTQVSDFMAGGKIPAMSRNRGPETRIDPEAMAQRRMSDGSIADNEDFSRRILKVTNPDGHGR